MDSLIDSCTIPRLAHPLPTSSHLLRSCSCIEPISYLKGHSSTGARKRVADRKGERPNITHYTQQTSRCVVQYLFDQKDNSFIVIRVRRKQTSRF